MGFFDAAKAASKAAAKGSATGKTGSGKGVWGLLVASQAQAQQQPRTKPLKLEGEYSSMKDFGARRKRSGPRRSY